MPYIIFDGNYPIGIIADRFNKHEINTKIRNNSKPMICIFHFDELSDYNLKCLEKNPRINKKIILDIFHRLGKYL